jgi:phage/plasmid-like protein (TIGR03299 family)
MSHELDFSQNKPAIAYAGRLPWHGLGEKIDGDATIEHWQVAAGLNWHIEKRPLAYGVRESNGVIVPRNYPKLYAHVRSDTQAPIGTGSDRFQIVQPGDALEFFRQIVEDTEFKLHTAGALKGGAKFWAMARWHGDIVIGDSGRDRVQPNILMATANDGTMSSVVHRIAFSVVCANTMNAAVGSNGRGAEIKVPHSTRFNAADVHAQLAESDARFKQFAIDADTLSQDKISDAAAIELFVDLYAKKNSAGEIENEKTVKKVVGELMHLYRRGPGADVETRRGTSWGAVNAVTHYADHKSRARTDENRFDSAQFSANALMKDLAMSRALERLAA